MPVRLLEIRQIRGKLLVFGGVLLAVTVIAFLYNSYRTGVMARLYAEAEGYPPYYRGSEESQAAVKILATYSGQQSLSMLLDIAVRQNPLAPQAQTEAIKALSRRKDQPQIGVALAGLLQPQDGLDTRKAVAIALQNLPCNRECITSILHYLERIWHGEPNDEDRWILPPGNERVLDKYRAGQQETYANLYSVLRREKRETFANLVRVYGFGSDGPSPFALDLVSRLDLHEACAFLQESEGQLKNLSPDRFKAPRQELQSALASLSCK